MNKLLVLFCCVVTIQAQIVTRTRQDVRPFRVEIPGQGGISRSVEVSSLQDIQGLQGLQQGGFGRVGTTTTRGQKITGYRLVPVLGEGGEDVTTTEVRRQGFGGVSAVSGGATYLSGGSQGAGINTQITREVVSQVDDGSYREAAYRREGDTSAAAEPYSFSYSSTHEDGLGSSRQESGDESGRVTGFYTLQGEDGQERRVEYVADENGFRAKVITNEIGTESKNPAHAEYESSAPTAAELSAKWTAENPVKSSYQSVRGGGAVTYGQKVQQVQVQQQPIQRFSGAGGVTRYETVRTQDLGQVGQVGGFVNVAPAARRETFRTTSRGSALSGGNIGYNSFVSQPRYETVRTVQSGGNGYTGGYSQGFGGQVYGVGPATTGGEIIERRVVTTRGGSGLGSGQGYSGYNTFGLRTSALRGNQVGQVGGVELVPQQQAVYAQRGQSGIRYNTAGAGVNLGTDDVVQTSYGVPSNLASSVQYVEQ